MASQLLVLQFAFALTWVVYVIYLPALAAQAGIDKAYVPLILMMDQAIFIACDWAAGVYADRVGRAMGWIGAPMAAVTLASCAAFVALPFAAPLLGAGAFLALTAVWSATSSALRAPPLALVSRHVPQSGQSWVVGLYLLGIGVATALAPYLGLALKGVDPRIPFAAASAGVAVFALILARAERGFEAKPSTPGAEAARSLPAAGRIAFAVAIVLLGLGFQIHFAFNSAPAYLRFMTAAELPKYMPVFWIGFNVAMLPATMLPRAFGGLAVAAAGSLMGVAAIVGCANATSLEMLVAAQLAAGVAWAIALNGVFSAAMEMGRPSSQGLLVGVVFSALAMAALGRVASLYFGTPAPSDVAALPLYAWGFGAALLVALAGWAAASPRTPPPRSAPSSRPASRAPRSLR